LQKSLAKLTFHDGTTKEYEFAVNDNLEPTVRIIGGSQERLISWNPLAKQILKDGDWAYDIKPGEGLFANAAIGRTNEKGQREFWFYNGPKGEEIVHSFDGSSKITSWFTSGKLAGKLRQITSADSESFHYSYDASGALLRVTRSTNSPDSNEALMIGRSINDSFGSIKDKTGTLNLQAGVLTISGTTTASRVRIDLSKSGFQKIIDLNHLK
jgi:YD repeat-containing protein